MKVSRSLTSEEAIDTLAELFAMRDVPQAIRSDNGPEFVVRAIQQWLERLNIATLYVAPGSPWENGCAESFHSKLRDEFLSQETFESVSAARKQTAVWKEDYNHHRPHSSLGYLTPAQFAAGCSGTVPHARRSGPASVRATPSLQQAHCDLIQPVLS